MVILLVGEPDERFIMPQDFLSYHSASFRRLLANQKDRTDHVVRLPDTYPLAFRHVQNFLYTGHIVPDHKELHDFSILVELWRAGYYLGIDGLCEATIEALHKCRDGTRQIPSTDLFCHVWECTPDGTSLREFFLSAAVEFIKVSDQRADFVQSLPRTILSDVALALARWDKHIDIPAAGAGKRARSFDAADTTDQARPPKKPRCLNSPTTEDKPAGHQDAAPAVETLKLEFCFKEPLVRPFRNPVDPEIDGAPGYFEKITNPMDLATMKCKMDLGEYASDQEFIKDMRQMFANCRTYWPAKHELQERCVHDQPSIITQRPADKPRVPGPFTTKDSPAGTDNSFTGILEHLRRGNTTPGVDNSRAECRPSPADRSKGGSFLKKGIARRITRPAGRAKRDGIATSARGASRVQKRGFTSGPTKSAKGIRFTDWRFREGTSGTDETHLIDIQVERPGEEGTSWMAEEVAFRKFKSDLLEFWTREGGRESAIRGRGGTIDRNTAYLIHRIMGSHQSDGEKTYYVAWVGYGDAFNTLEPEAALPKGASAKLRPQTTSALSREA
ncbi:hypothetical protein GE09DRAFT_1293050 [Coniochaeta sp. 2T2.1]|nr:hypothetical protein GE09DRAFT_1293050 [Coniochaeta sp. 2T2.1]